MHEDIFYMMQVYQQKKTFSDDIEMGKFDHCNECQSPN